jgi:cytochrome c553
MIRRVVLAAVLLGAAAPPPPGASSCSGCHGGSAPVPVLAGRPATDTIAALEAFRAGTKPATVMNRIVKGFTPEETQAIATWWAGRSP